MTLSQNSLDQWKIIDLSHPISKEIPIWPGDPAIQIEAWSSFEKDGYSLNRLIIGEHSGTHFGCPNHFLKEGRSLESYSAQDLVRPAVVIDVRSAVQQNPDYCLSTADVVSWESVNGTIPAESVVLLLTGWSSYWLSPQRYLGLDNGDGSHHWPGFHFDTVSLLVTKRKVVGLGIDTHGIDPGTDGELRSNTLLFRQGCFHLENLANLDQLPFVGTILVIGVLPIVGGTGSPARIFAFVPKA